MFCIGGVNLQTSPQLLPIANDKECKMEQISQNIEKSAPFFVFTPPRFLHPYHPLLAQGKFDVFNLLTECSIRGKLALDFLTTVEDGGMVAPTQFTTYLRQRHIRKLLT